MTENDHELTTETFAFVDTIDDLESERKQTGNVSTCSVNNCQNN